MKIVQINATCGAGSTGKICVAVSELLTMSGIENYIFYSSGYSDHPYGKKYMTELEVKIQALKSQMFGNYGFQTKSATKRLIAELDAIEPDIVHLHNLHCHNVHLGVLFTYLKNKGIKIFWTFHDCWAFTGYCPHFDMIGCNKWKFDGCKKCIQKSRYSWFFDCSQSIFKKKNELFSNLDFTIITPSYWLADQVNQSFLRGVPIKVINNGIDLSVFYPRESFFLKKYNLENKFVVLGVAFAWSERKGLDVFVKLSQDLDDRFKIVLVGTNEEIDKSLPSNILSIHCTQNQAELAAIYTAADVFVNPTREENFPTTHMESLACGTPVITFDTGGCAEILNEKCGAIVKKNDIEALKENIIFVCEKKVFPKEDCIIRAKDFDQQIKFEEYMCLYDLPTD